MHEGGLSFGEIADGQVVQPELAAIAGTNAILAQRPQATIESQMSDLDIFAIGQV